MNVAQSPVEMIRDQSEGRQVQPIAELYRLKRKLRLLLVITRLTVGGDTNVLLDIAQYCREHPSIEAEIAAGPVPTAEIDLTYLAREAGIPVFIIPNLMNRPDPSLIARGVFELWSLIRRRQYDIVHTHSSAAGIVGRIAAVLARVPVIVHHVHGWGLQDEMLLPLKYTYLWSERFCARLTDKLVAVSAPTVQKGLAHRIGSETKYQLIYNGIDLRRFGNQEDTATIRAELGLEPGCKVVGMVGRLDPQKNPTDFVKAAALVVRNHPHVQFIFVGEGVLRAQCEQLVKELNLKEKCFLLGFRNDVHRILPLIDVLVSTSLWEGLPVAFQEAMCAGKPIIANDVDGVSDLVHHGETGYLVTPRNTQEMADRILQLLTNELLSSRLGSHAREVSATFSRERMLSQIEALYLQLASSQIASSERALSGN